MASKKAYALRISDPIFSAVQRWADDDLRSVNGQIEFLLREALRSAGRLNSGPDSGLDSGPDSGAPDHHGETEASPGPPKASD